MKVDIVARINQNTSFVTTKKICVTWTKLQALPFTKQSNSENDINLWKQKKQTTYEQIKTFLKQFNMNFPRIQKLVTFTYQIASEKRLNLHSSQHLPASK